MPTSTASPNVFVLQQHFHIPQLHRYRRITLYLPPNYHNSNLRFPVVYMQDGQNLFDAATAFAREWKIDKTLNALHKRKQSLATIVVGIDNGGQHRADEYSAWHRPRMGGGEAAQFADFLVHTLKPYIDTHFRTLPDTMHTTIGGSSMGGLFSLFAGLRYPHVFGKIGSLSPSLWFSPAIYDLATEKVQTYQKIYVAGSKTESAFMHSHLQRLYDALHAGNLPDYNLRVVLRDRGKHNEIFWGAEFKKMFLWLQ